MAPRSFVAVACDLAARLVFGRFETTGTKQAKIPRKHRHRCHHCSTVYEHTHPYRISDHPQFDFDCPNPDCPSYFGLIPQDLQRTRLARKWCRNWRFPDPKNVNQASVIHFPIKALRRILKTNLTDQPCARSLYRFPELNDFWTPIPECLVYANGASCAVGMDYDQALLLALPNLTILPMCFAQNSDTEDYETLDKIDVSLHKKRLLCRGVETFHESVSFSPKSWTPTPRIGPPRSKWTHWRKMAKKIKQHRRQKFTRILRQFTNIFREIGVDYVPPPPPPKFQPKSLMALAREKLTRTADMKVEQSTVPPTTNPRRLKDIAFPLVVEMESKVWPSLIDEALFERGMQFNVALPLNEQVLDIVQPTPTVEYLKTMLVTSKKYERLKTTRTAEVRDGSPETSKSFFPNVGLTDRERSAINDACSSISKIANTVESSDLLTRIEAVVTSVAAARIPSQTLSAVASVNEAATTITQTAQFFQRFCSDFLDFGTEMLKTGSAWFAPLVMDFISLIVSFEWIKLPSLLWRFTNAALTVGAGISLDTIVLNATKWLQDWQSEEEYARSRTADAGLDDYGPVQMISGLLGVFLIGRIPDAKIIQSVTNYLRATTTVLPFTSKFVDLLSWFSTNAPEIVKAWCAKVLPTSFYYRVFEPKSPWTTLWLKRIYELNGQSMKNRLLTDLKLRAEVKCLYREGCDLMNRMLVEKFKVAECIAIRDAMQKITELEAMRVETEAAAAATFGRRIKPFCVYLTGEPGTGKTSLVPILARVMFPEVEPADLVYPRTAGNPFWTGYKNQPVVTCDDIFQKNFTDPNDDDAMTLIQLLNCFPYNLPMAAINDKWKMFTSLVYICTSNVAYPTGSNIKSWSAVFRRRNLLIDVSVKPEYRIPGETRVDPSKIDPNDLTAHYQFQFLDPMSATGSRSELMDIQAMLAILLREMSQHYIHEKETIASLSTNSDRLVRETTEFETEFSDFLYEQRRELLAKYCSDTRTGDAGEEDSDDSDEFSDTYDDLEIARIQNPMLTSAYNILEIRADLIANRLQQALHSYSVSRARQELTRLADLVNQYFGPRTDFAPLMLTPENCDAVIRTQLTEIDQRNVPRLRQWKRLIKFGVAVAAIGTAGYTLYKAHSYATGKLRSVVDNFFDDREADLHGSGDQKTAHRQVRQTHGSGKRVWNNQFNDRSADVEDNIVESPEMGVLTHIIRPNLTRLIMTNPTRAVNGFFIKGRVFVTVKHFFCKDASREFLDAKTEFKIVDRSGISYTQLFDKRRILSLDSDDIAVYICSNRVPCFKDILTHFIREDDLKTRHRFEAASMTMTKDGLAFVSQMPAKMTDQVTYFFRNKNDPSDYEEVSIARAYSYLHPGGRGVCGAPLIMMDKTKPHPIAGIHVCSEDSFSLSYACILTNETLTTACEQLEDEFVNVIKPPELHPTRSADMNETAGMPIGDFTYHGIVTEPLLCTRAPGNSEISKSLIFDRVVRHVTEPAVLRYNDPRITDIGARPGIKAFEKYGQIDFPNIPEPLIDAIAQDMINEMMAVPPKHDMRKLTEEEAINGIRGFDHFEAMIMQTSPGVPYVCVRPPNQVGKRFLFAGKDPTTNEAGTLAPDATSIGGKYLRRALDERNERLARNERYPYSYGCCNLKDERRKLTKIGSADTRVFVTMPVDYNILVRQYFLAANAHRENRMIDTYSAVGMDPMSLDFSKMVNKLLANSEYGIFGDFEKWDGRALAEIAEVHVKISHGMYSDSEISSFPKDPDYRARCVLADEVTHNAQLFNGYLIETHTGNISGWANTTTFNTDGDEFCFRLAWLLLSATPDLKNYCSLVAYHANVAPITYGDDNGHSVKLPCLSWYNLHTIADCLKQFGIRLKNEDETDTRPYKPVIEGSFLKNKIRYMNGYVWAPLMDLNTIMDVFNWIREKNALERYSATITNCREAQKWAAMYGRLFFQRLTDRLFYELWIIRPEGERPLLYTWDEVYAQYFDILRFSTLENEIDPPIDFKRPKLDLSRDSITMRFYNRCKQSRTADSDPTPTDETKSGGVELAEEHEMVIAATPPPTIASVRPRLKPTVLSDQKWDLQNMTDRWNYVETLTWDETQAAGAKIQAYTVPLDFLTSSTASTPFERFTYASFSQIVVRIQVGGTQLHMGCVAMYYVPGQVSQTVVEANHVGHPEVWTPLQNVRLSASAVSEAELTINWRSPNHNIRMVNADSAVDFTGVIVIEVLVPLTGPSSATTALPINVYTRIKDAEFSVPQAVPTTTMPFTRNQMTIGRYRRTGQDQVFMTENTITQRPSGFSYSQITTRTADGSTSSQNVTYNISGENNTAANSAKTGDEIDASATVPLTAGMDQADYVAAPASVFQRPMPNFALTSNQGLVADRLTHLGCAQSIATIETFDTANDEMDIDTLFMKLWTYKETIEWKTTDVVGTILAAGPITPFEAFGCYIDQAGNLVDNFKKTFDSTSSPGKSIGYLAMVEKLALLGPTQYHGSYQMLLEIYKTGFHQGRLGIAVFPGQYNIPGTLTNMSNQYFRQIELSRESTKDEFELPYFSNTPLLRIPNGPAPTFSTHSPEPFIRYFNDHFSGTWAIYVLGPLIASADAPTTVSIVRFIAGHPSLTLHNFVNNNTSFLPVNPWKSELTTAAIASGNLKRVRKNGRTADSGNDADTTQMDQPSIASSTTTIGATESGPFHGYPILSREKIGSLKELLRRFNPITNFLIAEELTDPINPLNWMTVLPIAPPIYGSATSDVLTGPGLWPLIGSMFSYWNGTFVLGVLPNLGANVYGPRSFVTHYPDLTNGLMTKTEISRVSILSDTLGNQQEFLTGTTAGNLINYRTGQSPYSLTDPHANYQFVAIPCQSLRKCQLNRPVAQTFDLSGPDGANEINSIYWNYLCATGQIVIGLTCNQATSPTKFAAGDANVQVLFRAGDDFRFGCFFGNFPVQLNGFKIAGTVETFHALEPDSWTTTTIPTLPNWILKRKERAADAETAGNFNTIGGSVRIDNSSFAITGSVAVEEFTTQALTELMNSLNANQGSIRTQITNTPNVNVASMPSETIVHVNNDPLPVSISSFPSSLDVAITNTPLPVEITSQPISITGSTPIPVTGTVTVEIPDIVETNINIEGKPVWWRENLEDSNYAMLSTGTEIQNCTAGPSGYYSTLGGYANIPVINSSGKSYGLCTASLTTLAGPNTTVNSGVATFPASLEIVVADNSGLHVIPAPADMTRTADLGPDVEESDDEHLNSHDSTYNFMFLWKIPSGASAPMIFTEVNKDGTTTIRIVGHTDDASYQDPTFEQYKDAGRTASCGMVSPVCLPAHTGETIHASIAITYLTDKPNRISINKYQMLTLYLNIDPTNPFITTKTDVRFIKVRSSQIRKELHPKIITNPTTTVIPKTLIKPRAASSKGKRELAKFSDSEDENVSCYSGTTQSTDLDSGIASTFTTRAHSQPPPTDRWPEPIRIIAERMSMKRFTEFVLFLDNWTITHPNATSAINELVQRFHPFCALKRGEIIERKTNVGSSLFSQCGSLSLISGTSKYLLGDKSMQDCSRKVDATKLLDQEIMYSALKQLITDQVIDPDTHEPRIY